MEGLSCRTQNFLLKTIFSSLALILCIYIFFGVCIFPNRVYKIHHNDKFRERLKEERDFISGTPCSLYTFGTYTVSDKQSFTLTPFVTLSIKMTQKSLGSLITMLKRAATQHGYSLLALISRLWHAS